MSKDKVYQLLRQSGGERLSGEEISRRLGISRAVGCLVSSLFSDPNVGTILITGGDTLLQCMKYMGVDQVDPVRELSPGVVLSRVTYQGCTRCVLTKSGGFGQETLVTDLARLLAGQKRA